MRQLWIDCETCEGKPEGVIFTPKDDPLYFKSERILCPTCNGKGRVPVVLDREAMANLISEHAHNLGLIVLNPEWKSRVYSAADAVIASIMGNIDDRRRVR